MNKEENKIIEIHTKVLEMADKVAKNVYDLDEKDTMYLIATVYSNIIESMNRKMTLKQQNRLMETTKTALSSVMGGK